MMQGWRLLHRDRNIAEQLPYALPPRVSGAFANGAACDPVPIPCGFAMDLSGHANSHLVHKSP
jgi:hypothetical protein